MIKPISIAFIAILAGEASVAIAGQAIIVSVNEKCNLAIVKKTDEYGLVTLFSPNAASANDVVESDFESIKYMRKAANITTGKDIMIRGVRYSTSRKILESEIPKECKDDVAEPATQ